MALTAANTGLTSAQTEAVRAVVDALRDKRQTLLGYVDTERSRLTSRDAEERSAALNELCAVVLQALLSPPPASADGVSAVARGQIDQLLPFLLSKVEDCGHLCDMLINTLHQMLKMYDGVAHVLPNECVDQAVAVLFDGGGAQSYGKRDRRLLFSCLDHLVATHAPVLRSAVGAQRMLLAFIRSAQGEREPSVLAQVYALHQRMTCNFSMGVLSEDMFELVACYFPIDYEPNEEETEPISREQLRYGCESALLAHDAFAPFCMQLVTEKLLETEGDGTTGDDGSALVKRQLEVCEFFIRCCAKFCSATNATLHEHVEDLMTAVRLLFMNPIQQRDATLLLNTTTTVKQMLHALASMLEHNTAKLNDPTRFIRLMAESTLENVEPFVLQAEMGTAGCAFHLLRCLALAHPVTRALCVPRALYWLNMLIGGQTLRSGENRAEIATEALMLVPEWLRFCFIADGVGLFVSGGGSSDGTDRSRAVLSAEARNELISATVVPLFEAVRQLKCICELDVLLAVECEAHSVLLLFLDTVPHQHGGIRSPFTGDGTDDEEEGICPQLNDEEEEGHGQLRTLCSGMALRMLPLLTTTDSDDDDAAHLRNIVQQTDTAKWARLSAVLKQFIALSAHLTMGSDQKDKRGQKRLVRLADPKQWPRLLELLPALLHPLPNELEQRRRMHQKPLLGDQNFASTIGSMLLSAFLEPSIDEYTCTGVREMARRLTASADSSTARDCFTFFVVEQLMKFVVDVVQNVHEHAVDQQFNLKRLGRLAELLQDVGALAVDNISAVHERLCHVGMDICRRHLLDHAVLSRALRTFWLLFLTHKNALLKEFAILLMDVLKIAIGDASLFDADEQRWLIDALLCVHFALLNTFGNDGGMGNELQQQILTSVHSPSVLLASLPLRMRAVETRNVLLAGPSAAVGAERLDQFFVDFMALSDAADSAQFGAEAMANLLDVHRRPTCPERCNYRRTLFWRQRLFCQFVPIFVQFARSSTCSSVKRQVLLQLLGPLLQIIDHQLSVDSVLNELGQLHPVIVDALVDVLLPQDDAVSVVFAGTDQASLLDVLRTSLERMPPAAAGGTEIAQQVPRLVHALTANIARQTLLVQSKALECLRLLALPRLGIPPEVLLPLHVCMLRTGVLLAGSRKRLVRQRMALARNAWDLALA